MARPKKTEPNMTWQEIVAEATKRRDAIRPQLEANRDLERELEILDRMIAAQDAP